MKRKRFFHSDISYSDPDEEALFRSKCTDLELEFDSTFFVDLDEDLTDGDEDSVDGANL